MRDLHKNIKIIHAITAQAIGTSGIAGGKLSAFIDRRGYDAVEFIINAGASASVADTVTPVIYECDTTGGSFTSVADADLIGNETALTLTAAKSKSIGYKGNKPYLKIRVYGTGHATGLVAANAVLGFPHVAPIVT